MCASIDAELLVGVIGVKSNIAIAAVAVAATPNACSANLATRDPGSTTRVMEAVPARKISRLSIAMHLLVLVCGYGRVHEAKPLTWVASQTD